MLYTFKTAVLTFKLWFWFLTFVSFCSETVTTLVLGILSTTANNHTLPYSSDNYSGKPQVRHYIT